MSSQSSEVRSPGAVNLQWWQGERPDFSLPAGESCATCFAYLFCSGIGCTTGERTQCDYWPVRYRKGERAAA